MQMETTILITLICLTFILFLTGVSSVNKWARLVLVILGLVSYISATAYQWSVASYIDEISFLPVFTWLQVAFLGGMLLGNVVLRAQAGKLMLAVDEATHAGRKFLLVLVVPLLFFIFWSALPMFDVAVNPPQLIYDREFFYQRLPGWVLSVVHIGLLLYISLFKVGVYERAVVFILHYIKWSEITSFSSYVLDGQEKISIRYKIFPWQKEPASINMVAPKNKKQMLREILLAKNIPEQT